LPMALGGVLASTLYGVMPLDEATYLLAFIGVAGVALGASAVPAGRAASVDPLIALRTE
jgi:ABC-type antimicrobial peptide transport system permease subunit